MQGIKETIQIEDINDKWPLTRQFYRELLFMYKSLNIGYYRG